MTTTKIMGRPRKPERFITANCNYCKKEITVLRHRLDKSISKKLYCTQKCFHHFRMTITKQIIQNCRGCNTEIPIYESRYKSSKFKNFFCGRKCQTMYASKTATRRSRFFTHYFCNHCGKYSPIEECKIHETPNKTQKYPICPNPDCGKFKMQTRPRHSRTRQKFREQMKIKINNELLKQNGKTKINN